MELSISKNTGETRLDSYFNLHSDKLVSGRQNNKDCKGVSILTSNIDRDTDR
jgi:hypothetical protein